LISESETTNRAEILMLIVSDFMDGSRGQCGLEKSSRVSYLWKLRLF